MTSRRTVVCFILIIVLCFVLPFWSRSKRSNVNFSYGDVKPAIVDSNGKIHIRLFPSHTIGTRHKTRYYLVQAKDRSMRIISNSEPKSDIRNSNILQKEKLLASGILEGTKDHWELRMKGESYYGMGYLEAYLTEKAIQPFYREMWSLEHGAMFKLYNDTINSGGITAKELKRALETRFAKVVKNCELKKNEDVFWGTMYNYTMQLKGLIDGYNTFCEPGTELSVADFLLFNTQFDFIHLIHNMSKTKQEPIEQDDFVTIYKRSLTTFASAHAIDPKTSKRSSHISWMPFRKEFRFLKEYNFTGRIESFYGYPGSISRLNGLSRTAKDLEVSSIPIPVYDNNVYTSNKEPGAFPFLRLCVANALATTPESWQTFYARGGSTGSYQFIVASYNSNNKEDYKALLVEAVFAKEEVKNLRTVSTKPLHFVGFHVPVTDKIRDFIGLSSIIAEQPTGLQTFLGNSLAAYFRYSINNPLVKYFENTRHSTRSVDRILESFSNHNKRTRRALDRLGKEKGVKFSKWKQVRRKLEE